MGSRLPDIIPLEDYDSRAPKLSFTTSFSTIGMVNDATQVCKAGNLFKLIILIMYWYFRGSINFQKFFLPL